MSRRSQARACRTSCGPREQYERQINELQKAYGEAVLELRARKKLAFLLGEEERSKQSARDWKKTDSKFRSVSCARGSICRGRAVCYKSAKATPKVQLRFADPIKATINEEPSFARTVAALLGFNKNMVHRIFQLRG
jgi:hypothetical protein